MGLWLDDAVERFWWDRVELFPPGDRLAVDSRRESPDFDDAPVKPARPRGPPFARRRDHSRLDLRLHRESVAVAAVLMIAPPFGWGDIRRRSMNELR